MSHSGHQCSAISIRSFSTNRVVLGPVLGRACDSLPVDGPQERVVERGLRTAVTTIFVARVGDPSSAAVAFFAADCAANTHPEAGLCNVAHLRPVRALARIVVGSGAGPPVRSFAAVPRWEVAIDSVLCVRLGSAIIKSSINFQALTRGLGKIRLL